MSDISEMKSRRVDPALYGNADLIELEQKEDHKQWGTLRFLLQGIWMCADANGQFKWNPRKLRMLITKDKMRCDRFERLLGLLLANDYIHRYNAEGELDPKGEYCHVRTWHYQSNAVGTWEAGLISIDCPCEWRKQQGKKNHPRANAKRGRESKTEQTHTVSDTPWSPLRAEKVVLWNEVKRERRRREANTPKWSNEEFEEKVLRLAALEDRLKVEEGTA
jgi:hypothetical protein